MIGAAIAFLAEHSDIIDLVYEVVQKGVSKQTLVDTIKTLLVEASDAEMKREYPNE